MNPGGPGASAIDLAHDLPRGGELGQRFDNAKLVALGMAMYIDHRRDEAGGLLFDGEAD